MIINLVSYQVTPPWKCCFCFLNNGWRSYLPDMSSETSPLTYQKLQIRSSILHCSANSPLMVSQAISIPGLQTSSPVTVNVWLFLFLSLSSSLPVQAGVPQGRVLGPLLFMVFISDLSNSLENPLYLFSDNSILCRTICHPSDWQAAAFLLSADLDKITSWTDNYNMSFIPDKSHTLTIRSRQGWKHAPEQRVALSTFC